MQLEFGGALQRCCDTCNKVNIFDEVTNVHSCLVTETYGCSIRNMKIIYFATTISKINIHNVLTVLKNKMILSHEILKIGSLLYLVC